MACFVDREPAKQPLRSDSVVGWAIGKLDQSCVAGRRAPGKAELYVQSYEGAGSLPSFPASLTSNALAPAH